MKNFLYLTYHDTDSCVDDIVSKIRKDNLNIDLLISVGRGGMQPTRVFSDRLGVNDIELIKVTRYDGIDKPGKIKNIDIKFSVKNRSILLVDDISDCGDTIEAVWRKLVSILPPDNPKTVKAATLFCKKESLSKPTYFSRIADKDTWLVFPWEKIETEKEKGKL